MMVEYPMSIIVEPCINTDFSTVPISKMTYTIGSGPIQSEIYSFTQTPLCNYPEALTVINLPSFATHDDIQQNFGVSKTEDLSLHGIYDVTLRSEFQQPTDYTKTDILTIFEEYVFQIEMIDPCFASAMEPLVIGDMLRAVKQSQDTQ